MSPAVTHFFGSGDKQITLDGAPKTTQLTREGSVSVRDASAASILENVIAVSREFLSDGALSGPETVRSLRMVEAHLTAIVQNSQSTENPLPDKDAIPPNQGTWTETRLANGGKAAKEKTSPRRCTIPGTLSDRTGGLSSGRDAAPDAQSAAQNVDARTRATAATIGVGPPSSQPPKRGRKRAGIPAPSAPPCSLPPPPSHVHVGTASAPLPPPTPAWYPIPTAYPPGMYAHAPYHTAYPSYWPYSYYLPPNLRHVPHNRVFTL
ncbi:hypothetical protein BJY52DRAFT_1228325 [Lactarius psammicola]|nr:hypothetical protein BJY52DRAFT_1228325 [Lactarius psammicola]